MRPRIERPRRHDGDELEPAPRRFSETRADWRELVALPAAWPGDLVGPGWTSRPDQWMALVARRPSALLPQRVGDSIVPQCLGNDGRLRSQLHVRLRRRALSSQPPRRFRNWWLRRSGGDHPALTFKLYVLVSAAAVPWLVGLACVVWRIPPLGNGDRHLARSSVHLDRLADQLCWVWDAPLFSGHPAWRWSPRVPSPDS